jgi:hypothetical protein
MSTSDKQQASNVFEDEYAFLKISEESITKLSESSHELSASLKCQTSIEDGSI